MQASFAVRPTSGRAQRRRKAERNCLFSSISVEKSASIAFCSTIFLHVAYCPPGSFSPRTTNLRIDLLVFVQFLPRNRTLGTVRILDEERHRDRLIATVSLDEFFDWVARLLWRDSRFFLCVKQKGH